MSAFTIAVLTAEIVGTLAGLTFMAVFGLRVPWWRSTVGRHIFSQNLALTVLFGGPLLTQLGLADRETTRVLLVGAAVVVAFLMVGQIVLQVRAQRAGNTEYAQLDLMQNP